MNANEISFENLPKAVAFLSLQIEELKTIVKNKDTIEINNKKKPIFYEDELLDWIAQGKRKTIQEIDQIAHETGKRFK